jgi:hypothetical protein
MSSQGDSVTNEARALDRFLSRLKTGRGFMRARSLAAPGSRDLSSHT